jgi:subtilisin-like proprotein convertase family protein
VDNDGYASYPKVIAVAACNDRGKKSAYSDFGQAVWCAFPSNNYYPSLTRGIWTTDRMGKEGYNIGDTRQGDAAGNYTNSFGGTSSACPGAAGVAALVLGRNPNLRWEQVKDILRQACDRIDTAGGQYDASGHSPFYGYGRLNARRAVELAAPEPAHEVLTVSARRNVAMRDLKTARVNLAVAETRPLAAVRVTVMIEHSDVGDLTISIRPPTATGVKAIALHNRAEAGTQNLTRTYDSASTPGLAALAGKSPAGTWTLITSDQKEGNVGRIRGLGLELHL